MPIAMHAMHDQHCQADADAKDSIFPRFSPDNRNGNHFHEAFRHPGFKLWSMRFRSPNPIEVLAVVDDFVGHPVVAVPHNEFAEVNDFTGSYGKRRHT